jgi:hypothetical protein
MTPQDLDRYIKETRDLIVGYIDKQKEVGTSQAIKDEINANVTKLQDILDGLLGKTSVVTKEQLDKVDEELRLQKIRMLEIKSAQTKRKYLIILGSVILGIGLLVFLTRKHKK